MISATICYVQVGIYVDKLIQTRTMRTMRTIHDYSTKHDIWIIANGLVHLREIFFSPPPPPYLKVLLPLRYLRSTLFEPIPQIRCIQASP